MRLGRSSLQLLVTGAFGAGLLAPGSAAQPAVATAPADAVPASQPAPPPPRPAFRLSIADLYAGMEADYEFRRVRSDNGNRRDRTHENRDLRLQETLGLTTAGYLLDPNFLDYRAFLEAGATQMRFKEKDDAFRQTDSESGGLFEYDVSIDALKDKPISLHGYARRADVRLPRRFLSSLHELQTEAGASALAITGPVTTEIGYSYRDVDRRGNRLESDDESLTNNRFYLDSKWAISEGHSLRLSYDHEREENIYQGSRYRFDTNRDELRIDHELAFGEDQKHRFDTFMRYNEERGDLARDELEIVPRLSLQHTDKFKTVHRYGFYRFQQEAIDLSQHKFDSQALYQATKELRLSGDVFALYEQLDRDTQTHQYGINGDVTYVKALDSGEFSANLNIGYDRAATSGTAGRRHVRNEAHALGGVRPVVLRERNVILPTVIAHNDRFTRVYVPGVDYLLTPTAGRVVVTRIPWGRIPEGEIVYFDYSYEVPADAAIDTFRTDFRIEHAFKFGLTPYYYFEGRFQEVDESTIGAPWSRDSQNRHRFGARYGRSRWTVTGEYEIFDDTVEPYDAIHLTGNATLFRAANHSLDLSGELSRYWFEGGIDSRDVWFADILLRDRIEITRTLSLSTSAEFRRECDSVRGNTTGVDVQCGLQYTRGHLTVSLDLEYDLLSVVENRENSFGVFLNVRRNLTHLVPDALKEAN